MDQPKNEAEALLRRKMEEINDLKIELSKLEIRFQKEKSNRMNTEEKLAKLVLTHRAEKTGNYFYILIFRANKSY